MKQEIKSAKITMVVECFFENKIESFLRVRKILWQKVLTLAKLQYQIACMRF